MSFKEIIKAHLDKMAEQDEAFAARYALESKSLDACVKYIFSEAQKQKSGNCAAIEDAVVYGWAVHYYQEDNLMIDDVKAKVKHSSDTKPKAEKKPKEVKEIKPIKALVKDKKHDDKCVQLDLFGEF